MRWYKLVLLTWIIALPAIVKAGGGPINNEEVIREGVIALNKMIHQNEYNNRHHQSWKNNYVLMLDGNGKFIEQRDVVGNTALLLSDDDVKSINDALVKVNDKKTFGVYEIVYNNWYIDLSERIPENATIKYITDYQKWSKDNIRNTIVSEMKSINAEIFEKSELNGYEKKVGIVCGRVVVLLNGMKQHASVVFDAHGDESWTNGELRDLNAKIDPYLPKLSDVKNFLIEYPNALKVAFNTKGSKLDLPVMPYEYKPAKGSFFDAAWERIGELGTAGGTGGENKDPIAESGSVVYDYAHVLTADEIRNLISGLVEISNRQGGFSARVFISSYKTSNEDITKIREIVNNPGPMDVILWFHVDLDKTTHSALYLGKSVPQAREVSVFIRMAAEFIESLGLAASNFTLTGLFDGLSAFINKAQVPERFYNPESVDKDGNPDYNPILYQIFLKSGQLQSDRFGLMADMFPQEHMQAGGFAMSQIEFAFYCGAYNGLVEMVASMPKLAGWLIKIILNEDNAREELWEGMKAFANKCNLGKTDYMLGAISPAYPMMKIGECITPIIVDKVKEAYTGKNPCVYAATTGKVVFNIVMLIIPLTRAGDIAKIADVLSYIDPIALLLRGMGLGARLVFIGGKALYSWGKFYLQLMIQDGKIILQVLDDALRTIGRDQMPMLELAMAGTPIRVRVPPGTDLSGEWRAIRYMQDANGQNIISREGERLVEMSRGTDRESILGITDDAGKADGVADDVKPGEGVADDAATPATGDDFATVNGRVKKPGDRTDLYGSFNKADNSNIPKRYLADESRFNKLAEDPAQGGKITPKTRQEAMAGLEAEMQGVIKGEIKRGPADIEFFDGNGTPWDVKGPRSKGGRMNADMDQDQAFESIRAELQDKHDIMNPITNQLNKRHVILDCSYMHAADHAELWRRLKAGLSQSEIDRIVEVNVKF
ncbi:hypothetical protein [Chitinophaga sp. S165]|uniref:hypothetical protein n=1 Tax=Chitinophaga sp. S165 TaxID=2135462 RepID=UPI000D85BC71|nr:hypothetical protein [Chitinophaga sp. S165]PWV51884.1 hypothetical protein C7475_103494 [Chitinophaga sp. S165]